MIIWCGCLQQLFGANFACLNCLNFVQPSLPKNLNHLDTIEVVGPESICISKLTSKGSWISESHQAISMATWYHGIYTASAPQPKFHLSQPPLLVPQVKKMPRFFPNALAFRFVLFRSHPKASTAKSSAKSGNICPTCQVGISWKISWKDSESRHRQSSKCVPCGPLPWGKPAWWCRNFGEPRL